MKNVKVTNVRAGRSLKLPGGRRLIKGRATMVPVTMLMHKSLRKLIATGRVQVASTADQVEKVTDSAIHSAREALDNMLDSPSMEATTDRILDAAEDAVESVVDNAIEAVEDAVEGALDSVASMLGLGDDEEEAKKPAPRKRSRRNKADK